MPKNFTLDRQIVGTHFVANHDDRTVWAVYRLDEPYDILSAAESERAAVLNDLLTAVIGLPGRSVLSSTVSHQSAGDLEKRFTDVLRPDLTTLGPAAADAAYLFSGAGFTRSWWVALQVAGHIKRQLPWQKNDPLLTETAEWANTAAQAVARLGPLGGRLSPATHEEILALYGRAFTRHTEHEATVSHYDGKDYPLGSLLDVAIPEVSRRSVDVELPFGQTTSTTTAVVTSLANDLSDTEWLHAMELQLAIPVDWTLWVETSDNNEALKKTSRRALFVKGQEGKHGVGNTSAVDQDLGDLEEKTAILTANEYSSVRVVAGFTMTTEDLEDHADKLRSFQGTFCRGAREADVPPDAQLDLVLAGLPGGWPRDALFSDYRRELLPPGLASSAPFCGATVGDPTGFPFGTITSGLGELVTLDPASWPAARPDPVPPSIGFCGSSGSGKSAAMKTLTYWTTAAGHNVAVIDKSVLCEYALLAPVLPCDSVVVDVADGLVSMDPLRVLQGDKACRVAATYLQTLCRVDDPVSPRALTIMDAVDQVHAQGGCLIEVVDCLHALGLEGDEEAAESARICYRVADHPLGRSVFSATSTPFVLAPYSVISVPDLALPDHDGHIPSMDALAGVSLLVLLTDTVSQLLMDSDRPGALLLDEAWAIAGTPQGSAILSTFAREGRKNRVGLWTSSQDPDDIPSVVAGQLGFRAVFRLDSQFWPAAIRFLGLDDSTDAANLFPRQGGGFCVVQDARRRVASLRTVLPPYVEVRDAIDVDAASGWDEAEEEVYA